jgi:uncharacterized caspase-like protein
MWIGAAALFVALTAAPAFAAKKVALVVGNAAYAEAPLRNPVNDARAIARQLRGKGFEVLLRENVTKAQFTDAVADFGEKLAAGDTALFFFAGHGIQVQGRNYLLPVDARITSEQRVRLEAMDVEAVLDQTAAARASVSMMILDACRNNPFERRFRSTGGGLAQINAPEGTLIAYATAPGKVAADGEGSNGLYTQALLKALGEPGLKVEEVFKQVRIDVARASGGAQIPWEASSLTGDFFFVPPVEQASVREAMFWDSVKGSTDPAELNAYLTLYPNGHFAPIARARIAVVEAARAQAAAEAERTRQAAEATRLAAEATRARETAQAEAARQSAEAQRLAAEATRTREAAEAQRHAAEADRARQAAEAARTQAEAARLAAEAARLQAEAARAQEAQEAARLSAEAARAQRAMEEFRTRNAQQMASAAGAVPRVFAPVNANLRANIGIGILGAAPAQSFLTIEEGILRFSASSHQSNTITGVLRCAAAAVVAADRTLEPTEIQCATYFGTENFKLTGRVVEAGGGLQAQIVIENSRGRRHEIVYR